MTDSSPLDEATRRVVAHFLRPDGSLHTIPSKHAKRLAVLDHVVIGRNRYVSLKERGLGGFGR